MPRKQKTIHYLYKTTCLVTNRYYIGMHSTNNLEDGYMGSGKRLRYSIRKYGVENHKKEILEFFENRNLLVEAEKVSITEDMIGDPMCMNLMGGGTGGYVNEEHYKLTSKLGGDKHAKRIKNDPEYRKRFFDMMSQESKRRWEDPVMVDKMSDNSAWVGRKHSDETKKKMSEKAKRRTGDKNSQFGTCWITKDSLNKKIKKEYLETYLKDGWVKGRK